MSQRRMGSWGWEAGQAGGLTSLCSPSSVFRTAYWASEDGRGWEAPILSATLGSVPGASLAVSKVPVLRGPGSDSEPPLPAPRPHLARHHLRILDDFARENIYSLYRFNFSDSKDALGAEVPGPEPAFQLDRRIHLQRLRPLDGQNRVGFKLVSVQPRGSAWDSGRPVAPTLTPCPTV